MKVTFEYTKTEDTKSLALEYDGEYSQQEKDEALAAIIDTILPIYPLDEFTLPLSRAWDDYKRHKEIKQQDNY